MADDPRRLSSAAGPEADGPDDDDASSPAASNPIQVWPASVVFRHVEPGTTLENTDTKGSRRLKLTGPEREPDGSGFEVGLHDSDQTEWVAVYGLKRRLRARFTAPQRGDEWHETFTISSEYGLITTQLSAFSPCAELEVVDAPEVLDLGTVALGATASASLTVRNNGPRKGAFSARSEGGVSLSCTPAASPVPPDTVVPIQIHFEATQLGVFTGELALAMTGVQGGSRRVAVRTHVAVAKHALELLTSDAGAAVESLHFGTIYNGKERTFSAVLVNTGPQPLSFSAIITERHSIESAMADDDRQSKLLFSCFTVEPNEGAVEAFSQMAVRFKFAPLIGSELDGTGSAGISCEGLVTVGVVETSQRILLQITGKVVKPIMTLSRSLLSFGDCPTGQSLTLPLTIKNESNELPIDFAISRIAHFKAYPEEGTLKPLQFQEITFTFKPRQMGKFASNIQVKVCNGLYVYTVTAKGAAVTSSSATTTGDKETSPRLQPVKETTSLPKLPLTKATLQQLQNAKSETDLIAISQQHDVDMEAIRYWHNRLRNNARYARHIEDAFARQEKPSSPQVVAVTADSSPLDSPVRASPRLCLPRLTADADPKAKMLPSEVSSIKQKMEEDAAQNKVPRKAYKVRPTTAAEVAECRKKLSRAELFQFVTAGNKKLDFGNVAVNAETTLPFYIVNGLPQCILATLANTFNLPEVSVAPEAQVVPPECTATFEIRFRSPRPQHFSNTINYIINGAHSYNITIGAEAVPVTLTASAVSMSMLYRPEQCRSYAAETFSLSNHFSQEAFISSVAHPPFSLIPPEGIIPANGHLELEVRFYPDHRTLAEEQIVIKVKNGDDIVLPCKGEVPATAITVSTKKIDFGVLAVGMSRKAVFKLKNVGNSDAFFQYEKARGGAEDEFALSPEDGCIPVDATQEIQVLFSPKVPKLYEQFLKINVPGSKPFRLFVRGSADIPSVTVSEQTIEFGEVYIGSSKSRNVTFGNNGGIPAVVLLDLGEYPEFSVVPVDGREADMDETRSSYFCDTASQVSAARSVAGVQMRSASATPGEVVGTDEPDRLCRISIDAGDSVTRQLVFSPTGPGTHRFELPLRVFGQPQQLSLGRGVHAVGIPPPIVPSEQVMDFGMKVLLKKDAAAHQKTLTLTNTSDRAMNWFLNVEADVIQRDVFRVSPTSGTLQPGERSQVTVFFLPRVAGTYETALPLLLGESESQKTAVTITVKGSGSPPRISFDVAEVVLPVVPLGTRSAATFRLTSVGYESTEVKCQPQTDKQFCPIAVNFPDGTKIGSSKPSIKVEVTFVSPKPMGFTTKLVFFDDEKNQFPLLVSGLSDNSIATLAAYPFSFPRRKDSEFKEPVQVLQSVLAGGVVPTFPPEIYPPSTIEALRLWLNTNAVKVPIKEIPGDLARGDGTSLSEIIEHFTARKLIEGREERRRDHSRRSQKLLRHYTLCLDSLRTNAALLGPIKPEYLLRFEDYVVVMDFANLPDSSRIIEAVSKIFPLVSLQAWVAVICQVIRVFSLSKITLKSYKVLPGILGMDLIKNEATLMKSSTVSLPETILLRWLSVHYKKVNNADINLSNFAADFGDFTIISSALLSHVPTLTRLRSVQRATQQTREALLQNVNTVLGAMKEIGLDYSIRPSDVLDPDPFNLLLFTSYLYEMLPRYLPQCKVKFEANLNDRVEKHIELSNPISKQVTYAIKAEGSQYFTVAQSLVTLEPQGKAMISVSFQSPFMRVSEGRLTVLPKRAGIMRLYPLVFLLEGSIKACTTSNPVQEKAVLYQYKELPVSVDCPFKVASRPHVVLRQERIKPLASGQQLQQAESVDSGASGPVECSYWCSTKELSLKPQERASIVLYFLPFRVGVHRVTVFFIDDVVGEFLAEVTCIVTPPPCVGDVLRWCCEEQTTTEREIMVAPRNTAFVRAVERLRQLDTPKYIRSAGGLLPAIPDPRLPLKFSVEYSSPFYSGPETFAIEPSKSKTEELVKLPVSFHPKGPGLYPCGVVLRCGPDMRIFQLEGKAQARTEQVIVEFSIPCRQSITQDIPITNTTTTDWSLTAELSGNYFSGPTALVVKAKQSVSYPLQFKPPVICASKGTLVLTNTTTLERRTYILKGAGLEPAAEDNIVVECKARERTVVKLPVHNFALERTAFRVETDVPYVSGLESIELAVGARSEYELVALPRCSGTFYGTVRFVTSSGNFLWYSVEVKVSPPDPESTVKISSPVRKAVVAAISIKNPHPTEVVRFEVSCTGKGLLGDPTIAVNPAETATYQLVYSPLVATEEMGSIVFFSEVVGEFWYLLKLKATPTDPVPLAPMTCEVGKSQVQEILLPNPLEDPASFAVKCSNAESFHVEPALITAEPLGCVPVQIVYMPSSLQRSEQATITFSCDGVSDLVYSVQGRGIAPTQMEPTTLHSVIGQTRKAGITFRNPFGEELPVIVSLTAPTATETLAFKLVDPSSAGSMKLAPHTDACFGITYTPPSMERCTARLSVVRPDGLKWEYPIIGVPEMPVASPSLELVCPARDKREQTVVLPMPRLADLPADKPLQALSVDMAPWTGHGVEAAGRSLSAALAGIDTASDPPSVTLQLTFAPLRPLNARTQLSICKRGGGCWQYRLRLEATDAPHDDVIQLESALHRSAGVAFRLAPAQHFFRPTQFKAYISPTSDPYWSVNPPAGVMPAWSPQMGKEAGVLLQVTFAPTKRLTGNSVASGDLVVETDDMQWRFKLEGRHPSSEHGQTMLYIMGKDKR
eukprot:m51a1_g10791 hypothetical protein (2740) ;mRNA; f:28150-37480